MSGAARPASRYRAQGPGPFLGPFAGGDILDTAITSAEVFFATARRYAELHGVDADHLLTALRLSGVPGQVVTARLVFDCAAALAASGFATAPPANDVVTPARGRVGRAGRQYSVGAR